jgi:hypothetical protein
MTHKEKAKASRRAGYGLPPQAPNSPGIPDSSKLTGTDWPDQLEAWIAGQYGTAGWEIKLYNLIEGLHNQIEGLLSAERAKVKAEIVEIAAARFHDIAEVYIGMEGCHPVTAPEAYQQQILKEMYAAAKESENAILKLKS